MAHWMAAAAADPLENDRRVLRMVWDRLERELGQSAQLTVAVDGGSVTLHGGVGEPAQVGAIADLGRSVPEVREFDARLKVAGSHPGALTGVRHRRRQAHGKSTADAS